MGEKGNRAVKEGSIRRGPVRGGVGIMGVWGGSNKLRKFSCVATRRRGPGVPVFSFIKG